MFKWFEKSRGKKRIGIHPPSSALIESGKFAVIYLARNEIYIATGRVTKSGSIKGFETLAVPREILENSENLNDALSERWNKIASQARSATIKVGIVPAGMTIFRTVAVPSSKTSVAVKFASFELEGKIPYQPHEIELRACGPVESDEDGKALFSLAVFDRNEVTKISDEYSSVIGRLDALVPEELQYISFLERHFGHDGGSKLLVIPTLNGTVFTVGRNGVPELSRKIPTSYGSLYRRLKELGLSSTAEAEREIAIRSSIRNELSEVSSIISRELAFTVSSFMSGRSEGEEPQIYFVVQNMFSDLLYEMVSSEIDVKIEKIDLTDLVDRSENPDASLLAVAAQISEASLQSNLTNMPPRFIERSISRKLIFAAVLSVATASILPLWYYFVAQREKHSLEILEENIWRALRRMGAQKNEDNVEIALKQVKSKLRKAKREWESFWHSNPAILEALIEIATYFAPPIADVTCEKLEFRSVGKNSELLVKGIFRAAEGKRHKEFEAFKDLLKKRLSTMELEDEPAVNTTQNGLEFTFRFVLKERIAANAKGSDKTSK